MDDNAFFRKLLTRSWFSNSDELVRQRLLGLPADCNGFIEHLADRPDEGGGVRIISINDVLIPDGKIFGIFINFKVENVSTGVCYCYQYFCWKQGPRSGAKGILLVENEDVITHIVLLRGFSFAVGSDTYNCVGGFAENDEIKLQLSDTFKREVIEELGIPCVKLKRIIDLGTFFPDVGMTPNCPAIFAAVIDMSLAGNILERGYTNLDKLEMEHDAIIVPVEKLWGPDGFIMKNSDGFFLAIISRLVFGYGLLQKEISASELYSLSIVKALKEMKRKH